ncbi:MAG: methylated-DNA--[protein]-cysteine S-methyltransferase [Nitrosopumilus sp.]
MKSNSDVYFAIEPCTFGKILVAKNNVGICSILLGHHIKDLQKELKSNFPLCNLIKSETKTDVRKIIRFIENPKAEFDMPLDIQGTKFQQKVWSLLRNIPSGSTVSYTDIAKKIGSPKLARAVANACASNKLAVIIPCHRVVKKDGTLSDYRWSIDRKQKLLKIEQQK